MSTNDTNATPEQRLPKDVTARENEHDRPDSQSMAAPAVQPREGRDESERPIVDPVTGGII